MIKFENDVEIWFHVNEEKKQASKDRDVKKKIILPKVDINRVKKSNEGIEDKK